MEETEPPWPAALSFPCCVHSDAAYSTHTNKYVLTGYSHQNRGIWFSSSDDGLDWAPLSWISKGSPDNITLSPYHTIINTDGTDNAVVGQSFYLYYNFNRDWDALAYAGLLYIYRQKVTLK